MVRIRAYRPEDIALIQRRDPGVHPEAGIVIEDGDEVLGFCVVYCPDAEDETRCAAASLSPAFRKNRRVVVLAVREAQKLFAQYEVVIALQNQDEPTAEAFLRYAGFVKVGERPEGVVHLWQR